MLGYYLHFTKRQCRRAVASREYRRRTEFTIWPRDDSKLRAAVPVALWDCCLSRLEYLILAFNPAKGRPRCGSTKLDSGLQKRLRRSRTEDYGPRPQARARLARTEVGQRAGVRADRRPFRSPALVARADFLKISHFAPFSQFLHIKGLNFPDVFCIHVCLWPLWTMKSFVEIGPHVFQKSGR